MNVRENKNPPSIKNEGSGSNKALVFWCAFLCGSTTAKLILEVVTFLFKD